MMYRLDTNQQQKLNCALFYLKVKELKNLCQRYSIEPHGEKIDLIKNIYQFVTTGKPTIAPVIPNISKAKKNILYSLNLETLILYGNFKNDLKTRIFFKSLIGNHFHYTAFGIDWIKKNWFAGTPPTYGEFAIYWQKEHTHRTSSN